MICPGRAQVPELNLVSSMQVFSGEGLTEGVGRLPASFHALISAGAQEAGFLRRPPAPAFTSGSTQSFPFPVVCPGQELQQKKTGGTLRSLILRA